MAFVSCVNESEFLALLVDRPHFNRSTQARLISKEVLIIDKWSSANSRVTCRCPRTVDYAVDSSRKKEKTAPESKKPRWKRCSNPHVK